MADPPGVEDVIAVHGSHPGLGMTWQEVKEFLDHIRTTCMDERQRYKLEARQWKSVADTLADALRFHEDRRINPTSRGGPALARYDALIDSEAGVR